LFVLRQLQQGEFVSPERVEGALLDTEWINQIWVHGTPFRSYVVAVVVPNHRVLLSWALGQGLAEPWAPAVQRVLAHCAEGTEVTSSSSSAADLSAVREALAHLCQQPETNARCLSVLYDAAKRHDLQSFEIPRALLLEACKFSPKNSLLSEGLKMLRPALRQRYAAELEQCMDALDRRHAGVDDSCAPSAAALVVGVRQASTDGRAESGSGAADSMAREDVESVLTGFLADLLGASEAMVREDFTRLGGDSLAAIRIQRFVQRRWQVVLPLQVLFKYPAVRVLASYIEKRSSASEPAGIGLRLSQRASMCRSQETTVSHLLNWEQEAELPADLQPLLPPADSQPARGKGKRAQAHMGVHTTEVVDAGKQPHPQPPQPPQPPHQQDQQQDAVTEPTGVLLTGVTGFLGAHMLAALHQRLPSHTRIYCLVRPAVKSQREASVAHTPVFTVLASESADATAAHSSEQRLCAVLRAYNLGELLDEAQARQRIVVVCGRLSERLGVDSTLYGKLAGEVDEVFHAAARVNSVLPYAALSAANVDGTTELLRFCAHARAKRLHHVSTLSVLGGGGAVQLDESVDIDAFRSRLSMYGGYNQSKWVAERRVREAWRRGFDIVIYRPGMISASSCSGAANVQVGGVGSLSCSHALKSSSRTRVRSLELSNSFF
jgi:nucleoside-diphosphate-sugar epimerase/acyl carrier protein